MQATTSKRQFIWDFKQYKALPKFGTLYILTRTFEPTVIKTKEAVEAESRYK